MRMQPSGDVNAAGIQIAPQAGNSTEVRQPGAAFPSAFSMKDLQGFLSLFSGLVEENGQTTAVESAGQPAKRFGTASVPAPAVAKEKDAKPADAKGAGLAPTPAPAAPVQAAPIQLTPPTTIPQNLLAVNDNNGDPAGPTTPAVGETQAADTATDPASLLPNWAVKTSGPADPGNPQVNLPPDLAFALQLTWQSGKTNTDAAMTTPSPLDAMPARVSSTASVLELPIGDSSKNSPESSPWPMNPLVDSSISKPQPDPSTAHSANQVRTALQPMETPSLPRSWIASARSGLQSRGIATNRKPSMPGSSKISPDEINLNENAPAIADDIGGDTEQPVAGAALEHVSETTSKTLSGRNQYVTAASAEPMLETVPATSSSQERSASPKPDMPARAVEPEPRTPSDRAQSKSSDDPTGPADRNQPSLETGAKTTTGQLANQTSQLQQHTHEHATMSADGLLAGRSADPAASLQAVAKSGAPEAPQRAASSDPVENSSPLSPHPVREISLRVGGGASDPVDVQIAQRAGKVQVAVRTPDSNLAKSLQTNLGELIGRLEQKGFRTEAWTPVTGTHAVSSVRESWNSGNQSQPGDPGSGRGQQDQQQGQQQSNQRQQERWKAQLEETLSTSNTLTYEEEL